MASQRAVLMGHVEMYPVRTSVLSAVSPVDLVPPYRITLGPDPDVLLTRLFIAGVDILSSDWEATGNVELDAAAFPFGGIALEAIGRSMLPLHGPVLPANASVIAWLWQPSCYNTAVWGSFFGTLP